MQKAWFYEEHGPKEVLKLGDFPIPSPLHNQLLVEVRAAALNPIDSKRRQKPFCPSEFPVVPGCDVAEGQPKQLGTLAEFIVVEESLVAKKPKNLSFEEAASLPLAVQTAIEGFITADFKEGDNFCSWWSTRKVEFVKSLGADEVVDYTKTRYEEIEEKYDYVYDTIARLKNSFVVAKDGAPIIDITWPPSNPRAVYSSLTVSGENLEKLEPFLETGKLKAVIDPTGPYNFMDVIQAFGYLETGRARGKENGHPLHHLHLHSNPSSSNLHDFLVPHAQTLHRQRHKNPNYAPVNGTVFGQLFYFNNLYDHQTEVAQKQRTFRLLGLEESELYTTDTRNIEHMLKTNFDKYSKGMYNQDIVTDLFGEEEMLLNLSDSCPRLRLLKGFFDMQDVLMRCTLDSIFKVGFGVELNCLEGYSKEGTAFMKAFDDSNALVYWRYVDPFWKLKRFLLESDKDPEKMNRYLRDIILNFMIAGKDTSANTLSWFFYMLCKNPLVQEIVAQEVRKVTGSSQDDDEVEDFMAKITDTTLEQMHYLHATLTETLRLYPAVPIDGRCAEVDDVLPDGFRMKKGDGLYYMAYAMGRMTYIWGKDAEDFRPERWLSNGIFQPESPFKFVAFHAGPRICLGKDFAYRQMKIVSIALLRFFRFKLADDTKKATYRTMFTLHIDGGLHLRAIPRTRL
ncbi:hypothetical protein GH714_043762 [Hevea brasiliensis]|uniref:Enoyl reductase (ER) domain-containing protein n=1 Tax=Hevea brasiliensis TaxID=3981 RepID=A0A6A6K1N5_HEVBR|nr:hypothetical protein GH714_043762 [Hevea brasiliensis]